MLGNPTGDGLMITHWKLSILIQYLKWFGKLPTSTEEVHIIRDRERIQNTYMEEEDYIHSNSTPSSPCCTLQLFTFSLGLSHFALSLSSDASIIGINVKLFQHIFQHGGDKKAIKYGINHATNYASTLYQVGDELSHLYKVKVGYLPQQWQYPNSLTHYTKSIKFIYLYLSVYVCVCK